MVSHFQWTRISPWCSKWGIMWVQWRVCCLFLNVHFEECERTSICPLKPWICLFYLGVYCHLHCWNGLQAHCFGSILLFPTGMECFRWFNRQLELNWALYGQRQRGWNVSLEVIQIGKSNLHTNANMFSSLFELIYQNWYFFPPTAESIQAG